MCLRTKAVFRFACIFLLAALAASPRASGKVLVRIGLPLPASVPEASAAIEVLQTLNTCLIARAPEELTRDLVTAGVRLDILDPQSGDEPYFLVRNSAADVPVLATLGTVRPIEDGTSLFWTGSENVREILPDRFAVKRLAVATPFRSGNKSIRPAPRSLLANASSPAIAHLVQEISGERLAATIQTLQDFGTRYASTPNCESAGDYIHAFFTGLGLPTRYETITFGRFGDHESRNIVAEIPGRTTPEYSVILCAHYDSYTGGAERPAPGADDNASGTAAVLELARVLAGASFDFTVRFICFSAEEWGLYGSRQYAGAARAADEQILGVLNLDMIGYADSLPEDLEVFANPESEWLMQRFVSAAGGYTNLQIVQHVDASMWASDHSAFWDQGFSAILASEDAPLTNYHYHTTTDTLDTLNLDFLTSVVQATLAAAADLAQPLGIRSYLSHVANGTFGGGSYRTTFILFNNTDHNTSVRLNLTADDGSPLVVTVPGLGTASEFALHLPPGGSRMIQTDGSGDLVTGGAVVTSDLPIGLSSIFSNYDAGGTLMAEAGVGPSIPVQRCVIPVDAGRYLNTGLAILNPWAVEVSAELSLLDEKGAEAAKRTLTIAPGTHRSAFVAGPEQLFPAATSFRGTLVLRGSSRLPALALRQTSMPLSYTSLPVVHDGTVRYSLVLPHTANGSYDYGSFRTTVLIVNPNAVAANATLLLTNADGTFLEMVLQDRGRASSFDLKLEPNGSVFLQTDGSGPLISGAATISSDVPVSASGIFSLFDAQGRYQTEAGVAAASESSSFTLPVDVTGNFDTGLALFNPGDKPVQLTLRLFAEDGGLASPEKAISLDARHHEAVFVSQLFPGVANFRGSLAVSGGSVAELVLRQHLSPLFYTTLPVKEGTSRGRADRLPGAGKAESWRSPRSAVILPVSANGSLHELHLSHSGPPGRRLSSPRSPPQDLLPRPVYGR